jgi:hypothetical protein
MTRTKTKSRQPVAICSTFQDIGDQIRILAKVVGTKNIIIQKTISTIISKDFKNFENITTK